MSTRYVSTAEVKSYLGITSARYDTVLGMIIETCENIFDGLIESKHGLFTETITEYHDPAEYSTSQQGRVFFLKAHNPTAVTSINGVSPGALNTDYTLNGRRIELKNSITFPTTFPYKWPIVYTAGYATDAIPADVKLAIMIMANAYWLDKKSAGISSFKQDLLSVTYDRSALE